MPAAPPRRRPRPSGRTRARTTRPATTDRPSDVGRRFARGDEGAVREVVCRYGGAVDTVVRSIVAQPELAAEAAQLTFVRAWKASATFDPERELAPWLYCIARRTAIDVLRSERIPPDGRAGVDVADMPHDAESFDGTWEKFEVRRALDTLPATERDVVRLAHFVGLTHPQIADRLGVPVGTVKSRMSRAQQRLACALRHLQVGDVPGKVGCAPRQLATVGVA